MSHVMNTYARLPVSFTHGDGVWLWDQAGKRYLDALAGIAVNGLGHRHPRILAAINEQAQRFIHVSNLFVIAEQEALADRLCRLSGMDEVFFCNSGCEANEAAIKLARYYGHHKRNIDLPHIVVMEKSFHGRTLATVSASGSRKAQAGFEPLVSCFIRVPYNDLAAVQAVARENGNIVAVLLEVLQGEGGINIVDGDYLRALRQICNQHQWLLMVDEVQCGLGRTGVWFGCQHEDVPVDVMTLAKGLGSGVPIGACMARGPAAGVMKPGSHGATFGGNPLSSAAALATLQEIEDKNLLANAAHIGELLQRGFAERLRGVSGVVEIRGRGLMFGIELDRPCGVLVERALAAGLILNVTADSVVRFLPPLILGEADARQIIDIAAPLITEFLSRG